MKNLFFASIVAMSLAFAGCNPTDAKELANDSGKLAETTVRSAANASVAAKVNTALSLRKSVDMSGLHVEAEGGTVTIGGHVNSVKEKKLVLEIVRDTRGVDKVIDKIRVE